MIARMRWVAVLVAVSLVAGTAAAETSEQLFALGRKQLTEDNDPQAACTTFERAIKLNPTAPGTMLNLGLCYELLGKYATSIRWFRKAQAAAAENGLTEVEDAAKAHTVTIAPKVPVVHVTLAAPSGSEVRVDGITVPPTEYARVEVDPGSHAIVGRSTGFRETLERVEVGEGDRVAVELTVDQRVVTVDRGTTRRRVGLIVGASGIAALATSIGLSLKWRADQENNPTMHDHYYQRMKWVASPIGYVGGAALGAAVLLYFTAPGSEETTVRVPISGAATGALVPIVAPDQVGVGLSGTF